MKNNTLCHHKKIYEYIYYNNQVLKQNNKKQFINNPQNFIIQLHFERHSKSSMHLFPTDLSLFMYQFQYVTFNLLTTSIVRGTSEFVKFIRNRNLQQILRSM